MTERVIARRRLIASCGAAGIVIFCRRGDAQAPWDAQPEVRPTSSVVAGGTMSGPHYSLGPTVTTDDYLNRYSVHSEYGSFVAPSDWRLRRLIREVAAIGQLNQAEQSDAFTNAAKQAGESAYRGAKDLIDDPVATLSAIPEGIGSIFGRAAEQVRRSGRSDYEDGAAKEVLAVSSFKRELAAKLGVDVYSSNEVLQRELNRVAWASAAGNLSLGALSMATGGIVLQAASNVRLVDQARNLVEATPPSELSRRNRAELQRMRVPNAASDGLLQNRALSPRHQTIIVASMAALGDVAGRGDFVVFAAGAATEDQAVLMQQMAEMMASYSASVSQVRRIEMIDTLPIVRDAKGGAALLLPIDRLLWTARNAAIAAGLKRAASRGAEVWMTGDASDRAEAGLKGVGLALTQRCGGRLPLLD